MTVPMFLGLLAALAALTSLLTEAIKKFLDDKKRTYASNFIVLIVAFVVGVGGTAIAYLFFGVPFTAVNVICMFLMGLAIWLTAMCGYDKVVQLIKQFLQIMSVRKEG